MPTIFNSSATKKTVLPLSGADNHSRSKMNLFTQYADHPLGVRFETQEEKEEVVLFLRQHVIVMIPWVVLAAIMLIAPTVIFPLFFSMISQSFEIPVGYSLVAIVFWYIATFGFALVKFIGWYFNIYIVTNERIVDIDFVNLLYKRFSQAELARIQDISYSSGGIFATFFNYGNVTVQTAGEAPNLEFTSVPRPDKVVESIRRLAELEGEKKI